MISRQMKHASSKTPIKEMPQSSTRPKTSKIPQPSGQIARLDPGIRLARHPKNNLPMTTSRITLRAQHPHTPLLPHQVHELAQNNPAAILEPRAHHRPSLAPVFPLKRDPILFQIPKPGIMHITDTRSFECRDETAFRENPASGSSRASAHPPKPAPPHPDKLLNESFEEHSPIPHAIQLPIPHPYSLPPAHSPTPHNPC